MSDTITWHDEHQEMFSFMGSVWDVSAAKTILAAKPRAVEQVRVADLEPFLGGREAKPGGGLRIRAGITVDRDRVAADPAIDLAVPLIAVTTAGGNGLVVDGWHRVARAVAQGVDRLPVVYLTKRESASVQC